MYQVSVLSEYSLWLFWGMSLDFGWNKSVDNPCKLLLRMHLRAESRVLLQSMEKNNGISSCGCISSSADSTGTGVEQPWVQTLDTTAGHSSCVRLQ